MKGRSGSGNGVRLRRSDRLRVKRLLARPGGAALLLLAGCLALGRYASSVVPRAHHAQGLPGARETSTVRRVIDGDTVELADGRKVRYIGIDTPEVRKKRDGRWVKEPDYFGLEAMEANRRLVEGKRVELELDVQPRDRYGRTLAYVYLDGEMVNERLVADGYAKLLTIPPDVKYVERFRQALQQAKGRGLGLWADHQPGAEGQGEAEESVSRNRRN
ncbi:MAG: thermonuclease family protein [Candidatus Omnitrophica bacterium]|nr:thermonuclease family protein [Candidatus Omnitrophota bacterium]